MRFLEEFARCGVIGPCCRVVGIGRTTYLRWRKADGDFDEACDHAFQSAVDDAEMELRERGINGTEEPVLYKGEPVWRRDPVTAAVLLDDDFNPIPFTIRRKSDRLLEVYTRTHRPEYRERSEVALTGKNGIPLPSAITVNYVLPEGRTEEDYEGTQGLIDVTPGIPVIEEKDPFE